MFELNLTKIGHHTLHPRIPIMIKQLKNWSSINEWQCGNFGMHWQATAFQTMQKSIGLGLIWIHQRFHTQRVALRLCCLSKDNGSNPSLIKIDANKLPNLPFPSGNGWISIWKDQTFKVGQVHMHDELQCLSDLLRHHCAYQQHRYERERRLSSEGLVEVCVRKNCHPHCGGYPITNRI